MATKHTVEYVVYNDGWEVARFTEEADALAKVTAYDGDHQYWYEKEDVYVED